MAAKVTALMMFAWCLTSTPRSGKGDCTVEGVLQRDEGDPGHARQGHPEGSDG